MSFPHIKAAKDEAKKYGAKFSILKQHGHVLAAVEYQGLVAEFTLPTSPANPHNAILRARVYVQHAIRELKNRLTNIQNDLSYQERRQSRIRSIRKAAWHD